MWQAASRTAPGSKKSARTKARVPIHIKRVRALLKCIGLTVIDEAKPLEARVLLSDLSYKGVGIFVSGPIGAGQEVEITLEEPSHLKLKGKVVWCHEHQLSSRILSPTTFNYRAGIQFSFSTPEEEKTLKKLCDDFAREILSMVGL